MRFESIEIAASDVAAQREFYAGTVGLPVLDEGTERFTVEAGRTRLTFVAGRGGGSYHVAFNVPENLIESAAAWLRERRVALFEHNGKEIVTQSPLWDAHSVYFRDPDGNVAEFIARHRLRDGVDEPFDAARHVRCVSELGLPVNDVAGVVTQLEREAKAVRYGNTMPEFVPLGDEEGLLIVVSRGRNWFPTKTPATSEPLEAEIGTGVERAIEITAGGARLRFRPSVK